MSAPTTPAIPGYHSPSLLRDRSDFSRWRATEDATGRVVELLVPHDDAPPQVVAHALLVHRHIAQVDSPFVQRVLAVGSDAARPYVALERLDGRSLYDAVKTDGPLSLPRLLRLARQSALALGALVAPAPFAHRNLKPDNIWLDGAGNAKLCDYSLAIFPGSREHGVAVDDGSVVGTPQYLSPEQADASPQMDFRTDFYALGATLYFAATGNVPFDLPDIFAILDSQKSGELPDPRKVRKDLSAPFVRLLSLLMMKDPANRYGTAEDLLADIQAVEAGGAPSLLIPSGASSTLPVAEPVSEPSQPKGPVPPPDLTKSESSRLGRLAGDDAGEASSSRALFGRFLLWCLLPVWLVILANYRVGNPMGLPSVGGSAAAEAPVELAGASADAEIVLAESAAASTGSAIGAASAGAEAATATASAPTGATGTAPTAAEPSATTTPSTPSHEAKAAAFSAAANRAETPVATWGPAVMEQIRKGAFQNAARLAKESDSTLGDSVAELLVRVPRLDIVVAGEIMKREGREITLTYAGKARELVPVSSDGTLITTSFNGRTVTVDVSKLAPEEKLRWLENVEGDARHALGVALALQLADDDALARHAAFAGPLAKLVGR